MDVIDKKLLDTINNSKFEEKLVHKYDRIIAKYKNDKYELGVASGKCGFTTLRAFSPLILRVCGLFRYSKVYVVL